MSDSIKSEEVSNKVTYKYFYDDEFHNNLKIYFDRNIFDEDMRKSRVYKLWYDIHYRCYSVNYHNNNPSYAKCSVCAEWDDFGNFYKWYQNNYYEIEDQKMDLDKDILFKGNKVYSPDTCVFVPHRINTLFVNCKGKRGEYPVGVRLVKKNNTFSASVKNKSLGTYQTIAEAFISYKNGKEKIIKNVAEKYKGQIPDKLYQAMMNWKIEITD